MLKKIIGISVGLKIIILPLSAQPIVNNPLVKPPKAYSGSSAGVAVPVDSNVQQSSGAKSPLSGVSNAGTLPIFQDPAKSADELSKIPQSLNDKIANLYVSAIVDKIALLRTQVNAVGAAAGSPAPTTGANTGGAGLAPVRSMSYTVRDGEIIDYFPGYRILVRVQPETVTLYWLEGELKADMTQQQTKIVFKGSVDTNFITPVVVPPKLEGPDGGLDGGARKSAINSGSSSTSGAVK